MSRERREVGEHRDEREEPDREQRDGALPRRAGLALGIGVELLELSGIEKPADARQETLGRKRREQNDRDETSCTIHRTTSHWR